MIEFPFSGELILNIPHKHQLNVRLFHDLKAHFTLMLLTLLLFFNCQQFILHSSCNHLRFWHDKGVKCNTSGPRCKFPLSWHWRCMSTCLFFPQSHWTGVSGLVGWCQGSQQFPEQTRMVNETWQSYWIINGNRSSGSKVWNWNHVLWRVYRYRSLYVTSIV